MEKYLSRTVLDTPAGRRWKTFGLGFIGGKFVCLFKFQMSLKFREDIGSRWDSLQNLLSMGYPMHRTARSTYGPKTS